MYLYSVWFSKQTAIPSLNSTDRVVTDKGPLFAARNDIHIPEKPIPRLDQVAECKDNGQSYTKETKYTYKTYWFVVI